MARQTKIISLDDARTRSRRAASSQAENSRHREPSDEEIDRAYKTAASVRERRKRERTKARADKLFDKQFGTSSQASQAAGAQSEGAPRAAVYKGEMGARQRKSARMQRASSADPVSARINPLTWFSGVPISLRALRAATAVVCVLLVGIFLYTPAQQYYQAVRENERLAAEYSVVSERNENLDAQNDALASDAGMEDAVRQKYGYVKQGEDVVVVTGLSDEASSSSVPAGQIEPAVLSSSVKAPEYWYTPLLDAFFGVE